MKACVNPWTARSAFRYREGLELADVDEGHDVHAVNDDGHARGSRRQTPEDASLAGMGVNDVGSEAVERPHEVAEGLHVAERCDRTYQAGQLDDLHTLIHRGEDLRPRLSAVDENDVMPRLTAWLHEMTVFCPPPFMRRVMT